MSDEGFYGAQLCRHGHVVTALLELRPSAISKFCEKCGAATITACPNCETPLRGRSRGGYVGGYDLPNHCFQCGKPFPWTAEGLGSLRELIAESKAPASVKDELLKDLDAIVSDTPRTQVAAVRMKQFLARAGDEVGPAVKQLVIEVASTAAKKTLGL